MPNQTKYTENTENTLMVFGFIFSTIKRTALLMFNEIALLQFENLKGLVRSRKNLLDYAKTCQILQELVTSNKKLLDLPMRI